MKTDTKPVQLCRRNFLLATTAGAAGAAAVATVGQKRQQPGAPINSPRHRSGYRLTEHVRNYYRTAAL